MTVEFQSLTADENNLIRVAKYFHDNHGEFEKLVVKLSKKLGFNNTSIADMTGISPQQVAGIIRRVGFVAEFMPKQKQAKVATPEKKTPRNKVVSKLTGEVQEFATSRRLAIHISGNSDVVQRVAYDAAKYIEQEMSPGDKWLTQKEAVQKFNCAAKTMTDATKVLVTHNWIERADATNRGLGYLVK